MKKVLSAFLALALAFSLTACGQNTNSQPQEALQPIDGPAAARIRYAIGLLVDRNYIVTQIAQGGQNPASSFVAMGLTDWDGSEFYENAGHDPGYVGYYDVSPESYESNFARGIEILRQYYRYDEQTGRFTDFPPLTYLYNTAESHKAIGEYLQGLLASVGIPVQLENQEWNTFLSTRKNGDFTLARNGWVADFNDPICFLDMWTSDSGNNDAQLGRGEHGELTIFSLDLRPFGYDVFVEKGTWAQTYDVLIDTVNACTDGQTRYRLMHLAEDLLMQTGCILPIYFNTDLYMLSSRVDGFYSNPLGHKYFHKTTVDGGTEDLSLCLASEPETLDPALNSTVDGATLLAHLFAGLSKWDENGDIVADCAQSLPEPETNADGSVTYTYTLKEGLKWSDGQALTAEDFVFAWNRAAEPALGADYAYLFDLIRRDEGGDLMAYATDERTLQVTLNAPVSYWNELLAFPCFLPVRKDAVQGGEGWASQAATYVSNGAYRMTGWEHNSLITLEKNGNYHGSDGVTMEKLQFFLSDDANNMLTNFRNGTWLLIDDVPTNEIAALRRRYPEEFHIASLIGTYYLCWNANASLAP